MLPARCSRAKCQARCESPPAFGCVISKEGLSKNVRNEVAPKYFLCVEALTLEFFTDPEAAAVVLPRDGDEGVENWLDMRVCNY